MAAYISSQRTQAPPGVKFKGRRYKSQFHISFRWDGRKKKPKQKKTDKKVWRRGGSEYGHRMTQGPWIWLNFIG